MRYGYRHRTTARRQAARTQARVNGALMATMLLVTAALCWMLFSGKPAAWYRAWRDARGEAGQSAAVTPMNAPATPIPLSVSVTQGEPVVEVAAIASETEVAPRVLIYHTHASEAYLLTEDEPYTPSDSWRTLDNTRNVVAIGALLKETLLSEYGVHAIHDTGNYESPRLATAYNRSLAAMQRHKRQTPTIELFVDVHRDAYGENEENVPRDYIVLDGAEIARLMLVVGTGEGATGSGFPELPDFAANMALAESITGRLREADGRLARDIRIKTGRYNQHVSDRCMLVEVGHTANTFSQACNAVPYLAEAIAEILLGAPTPETIETMRIWAP